MNPWRKRRKLWPRPNGWHREFWKPLGLPLLVSATHESFIPEISSKLGGHYWLRLRVKGPTWEFGFGIAEQRPRERMWP